MSDWLAYQLYQLALEMDKIKYWLRYRWYMFAECWKLGIPLLGLFHSEFAGKTDKQYLDYIHRHKGHWEHWVLPHHQLNQQQFCDILEMPERYIKELLGHWLASCRLRNTLWVNFWAENRYTFMLHPETRAFIERYNERFEADRSRYERRATSRYSRGS